MNTRVSSHILISEPRLGGLVVAAGAIAMAIIYWLLDLRADSLDFEYERIFMGLFLYKDYVLALCALMILVLALLPPVRSAAMTFAGTLGRRPLLVAASYAVVLAIGASVVYHAHPLSMDEYSPYFQAKAFAAGHLSGRVPPELLDWLVPEVFQNYFLNVSHLDGRIVTSYWPGFSLLLTPFMAIGAPWLCNPVLSGVTIWLMHRFTMELFDDEASAGLVVLLAIAAPAFAINGLSFYSMPAHLLCNLAFALCLLRPTPRKAMLAGFIGSIALTLHNPVPHMLFAAPWLLWITAQADRWRLLGALAGGYLPLCLLLGVGWAWYAGGIAGATAQTVTAQSFADGIVAKLHEAFALPDMGIFFVRLVALAKLCLWAAPAVIVAAMLGLWTARHDVRIRLLAWSALATFYGYLFVPFDQGHGWGYRYFHSAWWVLPVLAVAATSARKPAAGAAGDERTGLSGYLAGCGLLSLLMLVPLSAYQVENFMARHLAQLPNAGQGVPKVMIVSVAGYYSTDLVQNDPFLRDEVMIMVSHGRKKDAAMIAQRYPQFSLLARSYRGSVWGLKTHDPSGSGADASDVSR